MTKREKRRRERELKRLGYRPLSAAEQVLYIIGYVARHKLHRLRLRWRLWRKPNTDCCYCCLWCKYFDDCKADIESIEKELKRK